MSTSGYEEAKVGYGGLDHLPAILLSEEAVSIAPSLTNIFVLSMQTGSLPNDWTRSNVVPLLKKANKDFQANIDLLVL